MLSGVIFLVLYVYLTREAQSSYTQLENVFSTTRTFIVAILSAPLVSICAPLMLLCRIYFCLKDRVPLCPFSDSLLIIALCYFMAFLALGMGSFHYFMPSSFLCAIFGVIFLQKYIRRIYKNIVFLGVCAIVGFIFLTNAIPQGLHYFSLNKVQMRNLSAGMEFLADYIRANKGAVLYFDGFCRGRDRCYYFWQYGVIFEILPRLHEVEDFDIKSKEPNGENFTPNPNARFSFYRDDIVSEPKSGDLIIVSFMSDKAISSAYLAQMKKDCELLFESKNFGYIPSYNLMSFGALMLAKWGVKHALSNMGNPLKTPSQFYVFRVR